MLIVDTVMGMGTAEIGCTTSELTETTPLEIQARLQVSGTCAATVYFGSDAFGECSRLLHSIDRSGSLRPGLSASIASAALSALLIAIGEVPG